MKYLFKEFYKDNKNVEYVLDAGRVLKQSCLDDICRAIMASHTTNTPKTKRPKLISVSYLEGGAHILSVDLRSL